MTQTVAGHREGAMSGHRKLRAAVARELRAVWADDAAPTAVEYAIMVGMIAVVIVAAVGVLGQAVLVNLFQRTADAMPN
jgi:Flp pilus assembly pilin Flp